LGGTAAAGAALSFGNSGTHAAASPVGKQNAGLYRYKVGDIEVTVVTDGANTFKFADNHITNKSREELNKALEEAHQPQRPDDDAVQSDRRQHLGQARRDRYWHRRGGV